MATAEREIPHVPSQREREQDLALAVGEACDKLNKALYRAWTSELCLGVELVTPKFHAMQGLTLVSADVFVQLETLDRGRTADVPTLVSRAMGDIE